MLEQLVDAEDGVMVIALRFTVDQHIADGLRVDMNKMLGRHPDACCELGAKELDHGRVQLRAQITAGPLHEINQEAPRSTAAFNLALAFLDRYQHCHPAPMRLLARFPTHTR